MSGDSISVEPQRVGELAGELEELADGGAADEVTRALGAAAAAAGTNQFGAMRSADALHEVAEVLSDRMARAATECGDSAALMREQVRGFVEQDAAVAREIDGGR